MKVYEGPVITCDANDSVASVLVEDGGRIAFVGDSVPAPYAQAERVVLGARALVPAFADTHVHFSSYSLFAAGLDVRRAASIDELGQALAEYAASHEDKLIIGFGASSHKVREKRLVSRVELDRYVSERPAFIVKYDGHACIVNSRLLAMLPPPIAKLRGFHAESGEMNQEACFATVDFCTKTVTPPRLLRSMLAGINAMAAAGIGLMHAVEGVGFPRDLDVDLVRFFARGQRSGFQTRVFFQTMDVGKVVRRKLPRIGGCFATALDGCFGSVDAALLAPYNDDPNNRGVLFYDDARLGAFAKEAHRAGLQIEVHAIGDAAFAQAARALAAAATDFPRPDHRHTIIHACLPTDEGLDLCAKHGIAIALQPAFLHWDLEPLAYLESVLGDRAYRLSPLAEMQRRGIMMSGGSDAPCTLPDPIFGIYAACNHYVPEQSLSVLQALKLFTANAAWTSFDEKERGSLEQGKVADLVLLDRNPLAVPKTELARLRVESLLLAGKPYVPRTSLPHLLWSSLRGGGGARA